MILIRNPFDALVADWSRYTRGSHTAVAKSESYLGKSFTCMQGMSKMLYFDFLGEAWSDFVKTG